MEVTSAIQFASEQNYYGKLFTEKVQITPLKYDQSLDNPLNYFFGLIYSCNYVNWSDLPLNKIFPFFVSPCATRILS
jgi:hypothetical protein